MSEKQKRVSTPENDHGAKRPRALAIPDGGVKREQAQGEGEGALVVAMQAMEEPQMNVRIGVGRLHCDACFRPLKPPTFKCEAGHFVCSTCCGSHGHSCTGSAAYTACDGLDSVLRDVKVSCGYEAYGCTSWPVYYEMEDHHSSCPCKPCFCPESGCEFFASPANLAEHFATQHGWPVTKIAYGKPCKLAVPGPQGRQVLMSEPDGCVFLVSPRALGEATALSVVCVRSSGAGGQFRFSLWADLPSNENQLVLRMSPVRSGDMFGRLPAVDTNFFLAVPSVLASGEAPNLFVCVSKTGVAAANSTAQAAG